MEQFRVKTIAIIGAGVIGTTCAVKLIQGLKHRAHITILSDDFSPNTTGNISAGLWGPYLLGDTSEDKIIKWSKSSYDYFNDLLKCGEASQAGIKLTQTIRVTTSNEKLNAFWKDIVFNYSEMSESELECLRKEHHRNYTSAVTFTAFTCEPDYLLPYLYKQFKEHGGNIVQRKITSFEQLNDFDLIINCAGLGAKAFVDDENLQPIRGQVTRVEAPWITTAIIDDSDDGNYIIPNINSIVLGGTHQQNDYNTNVDTDDAQFIYNGCVDMMPSLKQAKVLKEQVGLRPGRCSVRLETELINTSTGKVLPIIHNYGHGGSGVCLSWGCATEVCDIVQKIIDEE